MLSILRKRAQSTVIQVLVLAIAVVFIFWGVGTNLGNKGNAVAIVNDVEIPLNAYQNNYERAVDNFSKQFGGSIPKGLLDTFGMKKQVLNQMIQTELLRQGGNEIGLSASALATQEKIKTIPVFQENGSFNMERYEEILSQNKTSPSAFESDMQSDLLTQRVTTALNNFSQVPKSAIEMLINFGEDKIKFDYVILKSEDYINKIIISEDGLTKWYEGVQYNYKSDPKIRIKYLFFNYNQDIDKVVLKEERIKNQYEREKATYDLAERRRARHILFKIADKKNEQSKQEAREQAEKILDLAKQGQDFAELAKQHSQGPTNTSGGDLGFFEQGRMVKAFDQAVFSMKEGQISDIVESPFGYHIIKLETIQAASTKTYEAVRDEIATKLKKENAVSYTFDRASKTYEDIILAGSIDKYESENKEPVKKSDYFPRNTPPASISTDAMFSQSLLSLNKGELSSLVKLIDGYAIIFIEDIKDAEVPKLADIRQKVEKDYRVEKAEEMAATEAGTLLKDATGKNKLTEAATMLNLTVKNSDFIKRSDTQNTKDLPQQVVQGAFNLEGNKNFPQETITLGDSFYVFQVIDRQQGSGNIEDAKRKQIQQQLLSAAQNNLLKNWIGHLETKSKIWTNDSLLQ